MTCLYYKEGRYVMGFLSTLLASVGIVSVGLTCLLGIMFLFILGILITGIGWGAKRGKVRLGVNERNFDDFGR